VSQTFSRVIVIVLDSVGVGAMPDAGDYGDAGSHTLGNIARRVTLQLPTLRSIGLSRLADLPGGEPVALPAAAYGRMAERSPGKDSVTGHWELMGLTLDRPFPVFPHGFPPEIMREFEARIGRPTIGNVVASISPKTFNWVRARSHCPSTASNWNRKTRRLASAGALRISA